MTVFSKLLENNNKQATIEFSTKLIWKLYMFFGPDIILLLRDIIEQTLINILNEI